MHRSRGAAALLLVLVAPSVSAGEARASFTVSVVVPSQVRLEALGPGAQVLISEADVARGYVDVPAVYRVRHNGRRGYLLQLSPRIGLARRVEVLGLGVPLVVTDGSVEVHREAAGGFEELALEFRMVLDRAVLPGLHPLPVHVAALPH